MKRMLMFVFVVVLSLVPSVVFASRQDFTNISVEVPDGWRAVEINSRTIRTLDPIPMLALTDDSGKTMIIFTDTKKNLDGSKSTLSEIGYAYSYNVAYTWNHDVTRLDDRSNAGRYSFGYLDDDGKAMTWVLVDNSYNSNVPEGQYLAYQYTSNTITAYEAEAIIESVEIYSSRNTSRGSGGGGGCNSGLASLAGLLAGLAFLRKK